MTDEGICEVCGERRLQLLVDDNGNLWGPLFDSREHELRANQVHSWHQPHDCVQHEPDLCPFCDPEAFKAHPIMRRINAARRP